MRSAELLYIHPYGHLNDLVVPAGALSCMNAARADKVGCYAFEVADAQIRAARVVAIDVHWALALTGFDPLVRHVRAVNPRAAIVVGGVTAGHHASDLLDRYPIDYAIQGDSEVSFARLVDAILAGTGDGDVPNVWSRTQRAPRRARMTDAEFDATDCVTADWFPTYARVSELESVAFPQGRTIPVARGCAFRCPECYGSYASTFGEGYLMRSAAGLATLLDRARDLGLAGVRLYAAKPPPRRLTELLEGLAARGPFRFRSTVGVYLCTPPSPEDLGLLEEAFAGSVAISMIPPEEHTPRVRPRQLALENDAWREAAARVRASARLQLDAWTTERGDAERARELLQPSRDRRVKVSCASTWSVTRPSDAGERLGLDELRAAVAPAWTFHVAKLLSPTLARLLAPFQLLDEIDPDAAPPSRPEGPAGEIVDAIERTWRLHHLPTWPELALAVVPIDAPPAGARAATDAATLEGCLDLAPPGAIALPDAMRPAPLALERDHAGVAFRGRVADLGPGAALAIVPVPPAPARLDAAWLRSLAAAGLVVVRLDGLAASDAPVELDLLLRAQSVYAFARRGSGSARGRATLRRPHGAEGPARRRG